MVSNETYCRAIMIMIMIAIMMASMMMMSFGMVMMQDFCGT